MIRLSIIMTVCLLHVLFPTGAGVETPLELPVVAEEKQIMEEQWDILEEQCVMEELETVQVITITDSERDLLERLVSAEAKGESLEGQIAVANVVFNRVNNPKWADTIKGVIHQKGQFQPVSTGAIRRPAYESSKQAVQMALEGVQIVPEHVDCFAHHSIDFSSWTTYHSRIGNHKFWSSN